MRRGLCLLVISLITSLGRLLEFHHYFSFLLIKRVLHNRRHRKIARTHVYISIVSNSSRTGGSNTMTVIPEIFAACCPWPLE